MAAATHAKVMIRLRQCKLLKKNVRHVDIVMLPGVDNLGFSPVRCLEGVIERGDLHEIGSGRGNEMNL
jgi:hypothetical protein